MGGSAAFFGGTGGKIRLNVEKWSFSLHFSREFFQVVLGTSEHIILHLLTKFTPSKLKKHQKSLKTVFLTNFKQFPHFLPSPSPYFGAKFQILLCPSIRALSKLDEPKFRFQKIMFIQSYRGKPWGRVDFTRLVLEGLNKS